MQSPVSIAFILLFVAAVLEVGRSARRALGRRRRADDWLRTATGCFVPAKYARRATQLCSLRQRRMLACTLRRLAGTARESRPVVGRPRLIAVRRRPELLQTLASALEAEADPVTPAGILRVRELVGDGSGPLWGASEQELADEVEATLALLRAA